MKKLIIVFAIVGLVNFSFANDWTFDEILVDFSDTLSAPVFGHYDTPGSAPNSPHGVVVAPDGNLWISIHSGYGKTFYNAAGDTLHYKPIYVIDPLTGDHVSFSPITHLTFPNGDIDTLYAESVDNGSGKGLTIDNDGNILATCWSSLYRINYLTGAGMNKFTPTAMASCTEAAQDENGYIYLGYVGSNKPIMMLDDNFNFLANAVDTVKHINRTIVVTPSGNDMYLGSTWTGFGIEHWYSSLPGVIPFTVVDTFGVFTNVPVIKDFIGSAVGDSAWVVCDPSVATDTISSTGIWASSLDFDNSGILWAGALTAVWGGPMGGTYYGFDPSTGDVIDGAGIQHGDYALGGTDGPRGADWSPDGHTMYLCDFYANTISVWTNPNPIKLEIDDESENPIFAQGFRLAQNYPNPFNPTTTIEYSMPRHGNVNLSIYSLRGELVKTLHDGWNNRGSHEATWNGTNNAGNTVASGIYIYTLTSPTVKFSKRMTFIK